MKRGFLYLSILLFSLSSLNAVAQDQELSLQDAVIGKWTKLKPKTWQQYGWIPNTNDYWYVDGEGDAQAIYRASAVDREKELVFSLSQMNELLPDSAKQKRIFNIQWYNESTFYFFAAAKNGYVSFSPSTKKYTKHYRLPEDAANRDFSTASFNCAYTKGNNLFVMNSEGTEIQVSNESKVIETDLAQYKQDLINEAKEAGWSSDEVEAKVEIEAEVMRMKREMSEEGGALSFGKAVHRYEFGIEKGTFWSNNGQKLAFYRNDEGAVQDYSLPDYLSDPIGNQTIKYPMAGQRSETVTVGVYDVQKYSTVYLEQQWEEREYITNIQWDPTDEFIYTIELNRDQNKLQLNKYESATGNFVKTVLTDENSMYVHPDKPVYFLDNGNYLYLHERNGYRQLDYISKEDEVITTMTTRNIMVQDILGSHKNKVIFSGIEQNSIEQHIYEVNIEMDNGTPSFGLSSGQNFKGFKVYQLSDDEGVHNGKVNFNAEYILDTYSSSETPYQLDLIEVKRRKQKTLVEPENPYDDYKLGETEIVELKAENGTTLFSRLIKPHDFDKKKKYPVLVYVYNGPNVQLIRDSWLSGASLWMHYLANQGYLVYTLDGRGSNNRGLRFEQATFRNLGQIEMKDQLTGVEYLKSLKYVDSDRLAIHGWSYGGFMTLSLMTNYPDVFKVGVAGGPVTDWSMYEVMYTERYMDTPEANPEGYEKTSVLNKADQLKGDLLIIHGTDDDVVVPQHSMKFLKASVDAGVQIDFFMYPGHKHNVRGMDRIHLMEKVINYVEKNL